MNKKYLCKIISMVIALMFVPSMFVLGRTKWVTNFNVRSLSSQQERNMQQGLLCVSEKMAAMVNGDVIWWWGLDANNKLVAPKFLDAKKKNMCSLSCSSDGALLASGYADGTIIIWNVQEQKIKKQLKSENGSIVSLSFSHDGKKLACAVQKGRLSSQERKTGAVEVWDIEARKATYTKTTDSPVYSVCFNQFGDIAYGLDSGKIFVLRGDFSEVLLDFATEQVVFSMSFSLDGKSLAAGYADGSIYVFDWKAVKLKKQFKGEGQNVNFVSFSFDGKKLASADTQNITIWDLSDIPEKWKSEKILIKSGEWDNLCGCAFLPTKKSGYFVFWAMERTYGIAQGKERADKIGAWEYVCTIEALEEQKKQKSIYKALNAFIAFSPKQEELLAIGVGTEVKVFDLKTQKVVHTSMSAATVQAIGWDDNEVCAYGGSEYLKFFYKDWFGRWSEKPTPKFYVKGMIEALCFQPKEPKVLAYIEKASGDFTSKLVVYDVNEHKEKFTSACASLYPSLVFSGDGRYLAFIADKLNIRVFDSLTWTEAFSTKIRDVYTSLSFDGQNRLAACLSSSKVIHLYDFVGKVLPKMETISISNDIRSLCFHPSQKNLLAAALSLGVVQIFDVTKKDKTEYIEGLSEQEICSLGFSNKGKYLAFGSNDGSVEVWEKKEHIPSFYYSSEKTKQSWWGWPNIRSRLRSVLNRLKSYFQAKEKIKLEKQEVKYKGPEVEKPKGEEPYVETPYNPLAA